MRIGVVTTSYPRSAGDAAGSFVAGHVGYLRRGGDDVEVIAAGDGADRVAAPRGLFYGGGAPEAIEARPAALVGALGFSLRMVAAIARRARGWDATCAHWLAPSAIAAAIATRGPLLAIAHGGDVHLLERTRLLIPAMLLLARREARLAFVSDDLRARVIDGLPRALAAAIAARTIVQPMGVDDARTEAIVAARARRGARADRRDRAPGDTAELVMLARLVPIKGVDVALAAIAQVRADVRLVIAGDGPMRASLEHDARARGLGDRVRFLGHVDPDRRDALLVAADALLVPSAPRPDRRSEGTPLAALEALAAGVPVIASATGGLRALADRGARLVPPRDPAALAAAIDATLAASLPRPVDDLGWTAAGVVLDRHWLRSLGCRISTT